MFLSFLVINFATKKNETVCGCAWLTVSLSEGYCLIFLTEREGYFCEMIISCEKCKVQLFGTPRTELYISI